MRSVLLKRLSILFLISAALFLLGNNLVSITDPDEAFYCLTAHEMAAHHEWMTPLIFGQPQFEKPPLAYWLLEIAFKVWGESPFTARFFPAVFAVLGVMAVYFIGLMGFRDERKAFLSALVLATGAFYIGMGKMVFTDMIFSVFILWALAFFLLAYTDRRRQAVGIIGFYVCCALSTLTKTPLGFFIAQAAVVLFLLYQRRINFLKSVWVPVGFVLLLGIALPWYALMYAHYGHAFISEYFYNDHWRRFLTAEHRGDDHWFFYPATMTAGLFPWSLFLLAAVADLFKRFKSSVTVMDHFNLSWIVSVLLVFQFAHSKLTSYILPLFPALALMTGNFLGNLLSQIQQRRKIQNLLYASFAVLALLGIAVVGAHKAYMRYVPSLLPVYFLSGSLIALAGLGVALTIKERFQGALYLLALGLLPILLTFFMIRTNLSGYVSSHEASEYIPPRSLATTVVLTSKLNARGIRYFTGQKVAVIDGSPHPFFSPHPIPILYTPAKVVDVIDGQRTTYGVIRKNAYREILKHGAGRYRVKLLAKIGYDYVVRIEALRHS
ncbi:MAG: glycosyltransferase family 39 protein [Candidatus Omnitrophica bacterium]|nr:glycosyltransferase family 39 protein [Candidatus Omnitrophota bacterium]MDE2213550.1 glycosyltransferase family 39 protein [Candidatus Omnitrophota bacterium]MDE2230549.1 glycosyltransferase family 39 protein [Candidatus Omnitrophota bacterium]